MKHFVLAIVGIVLIIAIAGAVFSENKRIECLDECRAEGDVCAERAYGAHRECDGPAVVCDQVLNDALRRCQADYDVCRYSCDIVRYY